MTPDQAMAILKESEWFKSRPLAVQEKLEEYPPHYRYRYRGQLVAIAAMTHDAGDDSCEFCIILTKNGKEVPGIPLADLSRDYFADNEIEWDDTSEINDPAKFPPVVDHQ